MEAQLQQWAIDYLSAFRAANGQGAELIPVDSGFRVIAEDGGSTGFIYTEADLIHRTKRLRERAAQSEREILVAENRAALAVVNKFLAAH